MNLGEALYEKGREKGRQIAQEEKKEIAIEMLKDGIPLEKVAKYTQLPLATLKKLVPKDTAK
ncbi:hypothetical protein [uncultured Megasphaera sp.]|uniref:hypothetical protein n=1 Tax=uncultured Megasphaera sp. TaxID=165188 RepID=UPI00261B52C2|nr:hypothetical protein [uncultured Megasphaera sp.]